MSDVEGSFGPEDVNDVAPGGYEMLGSITVYAYPPEESASAREGYRVRIYVPYGTEWYRYFMRRLAERPATVLFVVRSIFGERG